MFHGFRGAGAAMFCQTPLNDASTPSSFGPGCDPKGGNHTSQSRVDPFLMEPLLGSTSRYGAPAFDSARKTSVLMFCAFEPELPKGSRNDFESERKPR